MAAVRIMGLNEAERYLRRLQGGAAASNATVRVGTAVVYAHGIEFGRRRNGRLARRAGGAFMLTGALESIQPRIKPALARALPEGQQAVRDALLRLGYQVEAAAKPRTPVKTGNLRRSIHTVPSWRGGGR